MNSRKLFPLLLLLLTVAGAWAQNAIVISQHDGTVVKFSFKENPVVSYSACELVLTTSKTSVQYPINRLKNIHFDVDDNLGGVNDAKELQSEDVRFSFRDGVIVVSGGKAGDIVNLYHLNGVVAGHFRLDCNGSVNIPTESLSAGVYIVNTKQMSFKFFKP